MKKLINIFAISLVALFAVSCNVDNVGAIYIHTTADNGVSFIQTIVSDTEVAAATTTYTITLGRTIAEGAQTVNLTSTLKDIGVPSSVTFEDGAFSADLVLNLSKMVVGNTYKGTISLANKSDYNDLSINSVTVTLAKAYSWKTYGNVKITDDLVTSCFGVENVTWSVKAEKADGLEVYRLLDPYGPNYPYNEDGDYKLGAKWVLDCTNPNAVTFDRTYLGFDWGYGEFNVYLLDGGEGKIVNKVITFPANGMVFNLPDYGSFYGNPDGLLKIDLNL